MAESATPFSNPDAERFSNPGVERFKEIEQLPSYQAPPPQVFRNANISTGEKYKGK